MIALAGNPNSGKTTVFNALTGARQHIANYPGVTVEKKYGTVTHKGYKIQVMDLPGTYSLTAYSLEEIVARDFLVNEKPDLVVDIVDASNLDRNLYLAVQFLELEIPLIIALNMVDVAESRDIVVDHQQLSHLLDVPVVPMVARSKRGIEELLNTVAAAAREGLSQPAPALTYGSDIDRSLDEIETLIKNSKAFDTKYPSRWLGLKCLEGDRQIVDLLNRDPETGKKIHAICQDTLKHLMDTLEEEPEGVIADHRYGYITGITRKAVKRKIESRLNLSDKIDRVLTNRIVGPLIMILVLYGIYAFTFWASEIPIQWLDIFFDRLKEGVAFLVPQGALQSLLISGVIDGVGGVLGFIPLIMFIFFTVAILEDFGYMARIAYMLDRVLRWFGLHGNSVMALIISGGISGGCAVPGTMATRTLRDPKERIATLLVVPFMNCGAKLPVYAVLIGAFFSHQKAGMLFFLTLISWGFALFAAKFIRSTVLRGPMTPFVMELPPYRMPTLRGLLIHTWERTWHYIKKAGTIILGFSVIFWAMMTFPGLSQQEARSFNDGRVRLGRSLIASPHIQEWVRDQPSLARLDRLFESSTQALRRGDDATLEELTKEPLFPLARTAAALNAGQAASIGGNDRLEKAAKDYLAYRLQVREINEEKRQAALKRTIAGRVGQWLETVSSPLGFDYRINIALVGGFAAKEVVVSTLGTAYSLGEREADQAGSLSARLKSDPNWSPLLAFTLIVFIMLYVPCLATVISIQRESSWAWAGFSILFNLIVAYIIALGIRQAGGLFGLGI